VLVHARYLVNSFHFAVRVPPEVLGMISSYLTEGDVFSTSQVCHRWRSAVLISSPFLWTRIPCRSGPRAIASLERCKSLPISLRLELPLPTAVLDGVLLLRNKIASLTITYKPNWISRQLLAFSRPSAKRLHIYSENMVEWRTEDRAARNFWQDCCPSANYSFADASSPSISSLPRTSSTWL